MNQPSFPGEELRDRREALGLSVDDVYRKLRIPSDSIRAFEDGRLEDLPAICYSAGFLRTYCELLGLNPDTYVDCLREFSRPVASPLAALRARVQGDAKPQWAQDLPAWIAITAVLVLGWVTYAVVFQPTVDQGAAQIEASELDRTDSAR